MSDLKWYTANTGNRQGLVIDENTGINIAVVYDKKHAPLIALAPEMLNMLKEIVAWAQKGSGIPE